MAAEATATVYGNGVEKSPKKSKKSKIKQEVEEGTNSFEDSTPKRKTVKEEEDGSKVHAMCAS